MSSFVTTTSIEDIKKWTVARNGKPVRVEDSRFGLAISSISIYFPGFSDTKNLVEISWQEWSDIFEHQKLEFLCSEPVVSGTHIGFFQFVHRN